MFKQFEKEYLQLMGVISEDTGDGTEQLDLSGGTTSDNPSSDPNQTSEIETDELADPETNEELVTDSATPKFKLNNKLNQYVAKVGTRRRITIPYDCWMDAKSGDGLHLEFVGGNEDGIEIVYPEDKLPGKNMEFRIAMPLLYTELVEGDTIALTPDPKTHKIYLEINKNINSEENDEID